MLKGSRLRCDSVNLRHCSVVKFSCYHKFLLHSWHVANLWLEQRLVFQSLV